MSLQVAFLEKTTEHFEWLLPNVAKKNIQTIVDILSELALDRISQVQKTNSSFILDKNVKPIEVKNFLNLDDEMNFLESAMRSEEQKTTLTVESIFQKYKNRLESLLCVDFPFAYINRSTAKQALTIDVAGDHYIKAHEVLIELLQHKIVNEDPNYDVSGTWQEIQKIISSSSSYLIGMTLANLLDPKQQTSTFLRAYCALIILRTVINRNYPLPRPADFHPAELERYFKDCLEKTDFFNHPKPFELIELLLFRPSRQEPCLLLQRCNLVKFMDFIAYYLKTTSFENWPNKGYVISNLVKALSFSAKIDLVRMLLEAKCDEWTNQLGFLFDEAFKARNLYAAYQFIYKIHEMLPWLRQQDVEEIFDCSFPLIETTAVCRETFNDPKGTCRLNLTGAKYLFSHQNLMFILQSDSHPRQPNASKRTTAIAFDKITKRLVWGLPLTYAILYFKICPLGLAIVNDITSSIHIFDSQTGEKLADISLPAAPIKNKSVFHITPNGHCYFISQQGGKYILNIGNIAQGKWRQTFQTHIPWDSFQPLANYVSFKTADQTGKIIVGHYGASLEIDNCSDLRINNNYLFALLKKPGNTESCKLVSQSIPCGTQPKLAGERSELALNYPMFELLKVCDNDVLVCSSGHVEKKIHFIDLKNKKHLQSKSSISCKNSVFIDPKRNTVWFWDLSTQILWKQSKEETSKIGVLIGSPKISVIHVDEQEVVYFHDS